MVRVCSCKAELFVHAGSVSLPLPRSYIQEHVVLGHFCTGWAKEQFIYLLTGVLAFAFFVLANSQVTFVVCNCLSDFYITSFVNNWTAGIEPQEQIVFNY